MAIKLEIEILGEIVRVRDINSDTSWSQVYPGRVFRTQDIPFAYDELRGMGNGKHLVKGKRPPSNVGGGTNGNKRSAE